MSVLKTTLRDLRKSKGLQQADLALSLIHI